MNKEILTKHINNYLDKINKNGEIDDLKEREQRKNYYQSYTKDKILSMDIEEFYDYLGNLWAMIMWGDKRKK